MNIKRLQELAGINSEVELLQEADIKKIFNKVIDAVQSKTFFDKANEVKKLLDEVETDMKFIRKFYYDLFEKDTIFKGDKGLASDIKYFDEMYNFNIKNLSLPMDFKVDHIKKKNLSSIFLKMVI